MNYIEQINGYYLTEKWFSFMSENNQIVQCKHTAVYLYIVEMFNKRQWVKKIGLPTDFTISALSISYKTYKGVLEDLVKFGFLKIEWSKNQYSSNQIELVKITKADLKHIPKHDESDYQSDYQSEFSINKTYKHLNNKQINSILSFFDKLPKDQIDIYISNLKIIDTDKIDFEKLKDFINQKTGRSEEKLIMPDDFIEIWEEWKEYRKAKRFKSYAGLKWEQMAVDKLLELSDRNPTTAKLILKQTYENSYQGFFPLKQNSNGITNTTNAGFSPSKPSTNNSNSGKRSYRQILAERLTNELKANGEGSNITIDAEICE